MHTHTHTCAHTWSQVEQKYDAQFRLDLCSCVHCVTCVWLQLLWALERANTPCPEFLTELSAALTAALGASPPISHTDTHTDADADTDAMLHTGPPYEGHTNTASSTSAASGGAEGQYAAQPEVLLLTPKVATDHMPPVSTTTATTGVGGVEGGDKAGLVLLTPPPRPAQAEPEMPTRPQAPPPRLPTGAVIGSDGEPLSPRVPEPPPALALGAKAPWTMTRVEVTHTHGDDAYHTTDEPHTMQGTHSQNQSASQDPVVRRLVKRGREHLVARATQFVPVMRDGVAPPQSWWLLVRQLRNALHAHPELAVRLTESYAGLGGQLSPALQQRLASLAHSHFVT